MQSWEESWETFFDLYHQAVRVCVAGGFHRNNWNGVDESVIDDVTLCVFQSVLRGGAGFDPDKGRFRHFLSTICRRRVADYIREHRRDAQQGPLEDSVLGETSVDRPFLRLEEEAFRNALLGMLIAALRKCVSPRVFLIFELVKLNGEEPDLVARQLGVRRGVVDNSVFKAMQQLRKIAENPEMRKEFDL